MAKPKISMISGPMNAKHIGGVSVTGNSVSLIDTYFADITLQPDEPPSHTFIASGKTEIPRRSDTIASTIRRPSISIKRSLSKLRRKSISHLHETHPKKDIEHQAATWITRSDSANASRPLRMQSSMSRLRQKVGLDRDIHGPVQVSKSHSPEPDVVRAPIPKDPSPLRVRRSIARLTSSSSYTTTPELELRRSSTPTQCQPSITTRRRSPSVEINSSKARVPHLPVRPKRADSGTAIDLDAVPAQIRPVGFKEILAVQSLAERMALYKKTREYWACADHGLTEWTERAGGRGMVAARV